MVSSTNNNVYKRAFFIIFNLSKHKVNDISKERTFAKCYLYVNLARQLKTRGAAAKQKALQTILKTTI